MNKIMKFSVFTVIFILASFLIGGIILIPKKVDAAVSPVPVYRLYNQSTQEHFFTINNNEKNSLLNSSTGWNDEGVAFNAPGNQVIGAMYQTPVFRFYNKSNNKHFWTTNSDELNNIIGAAGGAWKFEGVAFYAYLGANTDYGVSNIVYRLYNPSNGDHLYTKSSSERNAAVSSGKWNDETSVGNIIGFYAY